MQDENLSVADRIPLTMRTHFSITHIASAARQARVAARIEAEYAGFDAEKSLEHKGAVVASILMSIAAVEAFINEFFADCADEHTLHLAGLEAVVIARLGLAWKGPKSVDRAEVIDKYQLACKLAGKPLLKLGCAPAQDLATGISIRNALMHFKPQSIELPVDTSKATVKDDWEKVCKKLAGRVLKPNPFASDQQPDFPYRLLGHECAEWIFESARSFIQQFGNHMGLTAPPLWSIDLALTTR